MSGTWRRLTPALIALVVAVLPSAAGAGTNSTLPSQCAADDHPRGCWGNLRTPEIVKGLNYPVASCPGVSAATALSTSIRSLDRSIAAKKYPHVFMIPQAEAVYEALQFSAWSDLIEDCAASADPDLRSRLFAVETYTLYSAADWARIAGSTTYFQRYTDRFFARVDQVVASPASNPWAKEYALLYKAIYCEEENPDIGPQFPDYGRLFDWDDYHRVRCDNFRYG